MTQRVLHNDNRNIVCVVGLPAAIVALAVVLLIIFPVETSGATSFCSRNKPTNVEQYGPDGTPLLPITNGQDGGATFNTESSIPRGSANPFINGPPYSIDNFGNWTQAIPSLPAPGGASEVILPTFGGGTFAGDWMWLVPGVSKATGPSDTHRLFRVHRITGVLETFTDFPTDFSGNNEAFSGGVFIGAPGIRGSGSLWLIPRDANMVVQVNTITGAMVGHTGILNQGGLTEEDQFYGATYIQTEDAPFFDSASVSVSSSSSSGNGGVGSSSSSGGSSRGGGGVSSGSSYSGNTTDADNTTDNSGDNTASSSSDGGGGGTADGSSSGGGGVSVVNGPPGFIWMTPFRNHGRGVVRVSTKENVVTPVGTMTDFVNWPTDFIYDSYYLSGATTNGSMHWMAPYDGDFVVGVIPSTGVMVGVNLEDFWVEYPSSKDYCTSGERFKGLTYTENGALYLIPYACQAILQINTTSLQVTAAHTSWPAEWGLTHLGYEPNRRQFTGALFDGNYLWLIPFGNSALDSSLIRFETGGFVGAAAGSGGGSMLAFASNTPDKWIGTSFLGAAFEAETETLWFIPQDLSQTWFATAAQQPDPFMFLVLSSPTTCTVTKESQTATITPDETVTVSPTITPMMTSSVTISTSVSDTLSPLKTKTKTSTITLTKALTLTPELPTPVPTTLAPPTPEPTTPEPVILSSSSSSSPASSSAASSSATTRKSSNSDGSSSSTAGSSPAGSSDLHSTGSGSSSTISSSAMSSRSSNDNMGPTADGISSSTASSSHNQDSSASTVSSGPSLPFSYGDSSSNNHNNNSSRSDGNIASNTSSDMPAKEESGSSGSSGSGISGGGGEISSMSPFNGSSSNNSSSEGLSSVVVLPAPPVPPGGSSLTTISSTSGVRSGSGGSGGGGFSSTSSQSDINNGTSDTFPPASLSLTPSPAPTTSASSGNGANNNAASGEEDDSWLSTKQGQTTLILIISFVVLMVLLAVAVLIFWRKKRNSKKEWQAGEKQRIYGVEDPEAGGAGGGGGIGGGIGVVGAAPGPTEEGGLPVPKPGTLDPIDHDFSSIAERTDRPDGFGMGIASTDQLAEEDRDATEMRPLEHSGSIHSPTGGQGGFGESDANIPSPTITRRRKKKPALVQRAEGDEEEEGEGGFIDLGIMDDDE